MIPALIVVAVIVIGFLAWELHFSRSGQEAMANQNRAQGKDETKNF